MLTSRIMLNRKALSRGSLRRTHKKCPGDHAGAFCTSADRSHPAGRVGIRCSFPEIAAWLVVTYLVVVIAAPIAARPKAKNKTKAAARIFIGPRSFPRGAPYDRQYPQEMPFPSRANAAATTQYNPRFPKRFSCQPLMRSQQLASIDLSSRANQHA